MENYRKGFPFSVFVYWMQMDFHSVRFVVAWAANDRPYDYAVANDLEYGGAPQGGFSCPYGQFTF